MPSHKIYLAFRRYTGMTQNDTILKVRGLSVSFDGREVVGDMNYILRRGETLGIVGESGSGKSVSTLALMGLLPSKAAVTGSALLDGTDLLSLGDEQMREVRGRRISMIFQEPMTSLNPVQKCGNQVMEMMEVHRGNNKDRRAKDVDKKAVVELFREVRLPRPEKIFDSYPHELSGGQKQRVMIAMALINHPDIIIADEPTTALDVTVQKTILELLRQLQQKYGTSIIFITHDLGVIAQVADRIMVMYRGKVVEQGKAYDILHNPQHPYTKGLLACRPPLEDKPRRLPTVDDYMADGGRSDKKSRNDDMEMKDEPFDSEDGEKSREPAHDRGAAVKPLLSVRNLNVEYVLKKSFLGRPLQKLKAVDGISFDLYRGETLGLVGESGCGKTTLGRAILRLIASRSESITFDGQRLDTLSAGELRRLRTKMQIIFQDPYSSLNPRLTVGEAICEPLRVHSGKRGLFDREKMRAKTIELMERVGLRPEWYDRYPHQFSGGQRQRICIARALVLNPELVICDESVSALDVSVQAQVLNLLNDLKEQFGYTYIFISHDLSVVHFVSDRIMVMREGKIIEEGITEELYRSPKEEYTRSLLEAIPRI